MVTVKEQKKRVKEYSRAIEEEERIGKIYDEARERTRTAHQRAMFGTPPRPGIRLTVREGEILLLVREHLSNKEIGTKLGIAERTVKFFISSLLTKFDVPSRGYL